MASTTATATTIQGVSILTRQRRSRGDVFDIELSPLGIEIRRAGRPPAYMSWARVSQWEIKKRRRGVLLTLRGGGATTPLVVPGWAPDDLEVVMRTTAGASPHAPTAAPAGNGAAAAAPERAREPVADAFTPAPLVAAADDTDTPPAPPAPSAPSAPSAPTAPTAPAAHTEEAPASAVGAPRRWFQRGSAASWKPVVTVVLLGALATAVTLVLLQSAGIISWGFLGPTA